jgi:hypothetical protein
LWTGSSYREFSLWRERYTGGLSATEDAFAKAATKLAGRRRRRRGIAAGALLAAAVAVAAVTSGLWRRASNEALRAEASKLLALGQVELEPNPTAALAYAIKSLELADTEEARRFALRTLADAQPHDLGNSGTGAKLVEFSRDGEWLAVGGFRRAAILNRDGRAPLVLPEAYPSAGFNVVHVDFTPSGDTLVTSQDGDVRFWSIPEGQETGERKKTDNASRFFLRGEGLVTFATVGEREVFRWLPLGEGDSSLIGTTELLGRPDIDAAGTRAAYHLDGKFSCALSRTGPLGLFSSISRIPSGASSSIRTAVTSR